MVKNIEITVDENGNEITLIHLISEKGYFTRNGENIGYHLVFPPGVRPNDIREVRDRSTLHSIDGPITYITE